MDNIQWNLKRNSQENVFDDACEMAAMFVLAWMC